MTALELRLICYGLVFLIIVGGAGTAGYRLATHHYQALMAADTAAQQEALADAQRQVIAAQQAQAAATDAAEKQYENLKANSDALGQRLTDSLRQYAALRSVLVSQAARPATEPHAAGEGSGSPAGIADLAGRAATACEEDAAELTALQTWARGISQR